MASRGSHLQGTLHALLPPHIGEIEVKIVLLLVKFLPRIDHAWAEAVVVSFQKTNDIGKVAHAIDIQLIDHSGLMLVGFGHYQPLELVLARPDGDGQRALYGLKRAVKAQLSHEHKAVQPVGRNVAVGR